MNACLEKPINSLSANLLGMQAVECSPISNNDAFINMMTYVGSQDLKTHSNSNNQTCNMNIKISMGH